jgi:hypothetical protein
MMGDIKAKKQNLNIMKNQFKLAIVALAASIAVIACDPSKPAKTETPVDSVKTTGVDSLKKDTVLKTDSVKADSVKK